MGEERSTWHCQSQGPLRSLEVVDQRQGLRIMDDDGIGLCQMKPGGILEHDLLVDRFLASEKLDLSPCSALWNFLVQSKKAGVPWIRRHPVSMPRAFIISVSGVRISVTPPP